MNSLIKRSVFLLILVVGFTACNKKPVPLTVTPEEYHHAVDKVVQIQVHDIFSPPQVARIFAYANIAAYEAMLTDTSAYKSLAGQVRDLKKTPAPKDTTALNHEVASLVAFYEISRQLLFSEDMLTVVRDSMYSDWEKQDPESFKTSKTYGMEVAAHIADWMKGDNYAQTRTMPKFSVRTEDEGRWQPTPPAYMDGIEPHWNKIRPLVIKTSDQFKPVPPPAFSMEKGSEFYKELMEVYNVRNAMDTSKVDIHEGKAIAKFWNCNPYVSTQKGHLMFAIKNMSPGAHWLCIAKIACRKADAGFEKTVAAYTETSIALDDAFISCWDEKYRSNLIRPETLINAHIDENWTPLLQTPPFPEYTSGHSVASGAAAVVLTSIFGDNFSFDDDTETIYGLPVRSYDSFNKASAEAAISRMYGGIHYRASIEKGLTQGRQVGHYVVNTIDMKKKPDALAAQSNGGK